jgi:mono/diheme cytochrome c family protein
MCTKTFSRAALVLTLTFLVAGSLWAQAEIKSVPMNAETARMTDGHDTYVTLCATCHGTLGRGNGPVANALKTKMPDLTQLAKNNGGEFPTAKVRESLAAEVGAVTAHGSTEMPVWGAVFLESQGRAMAMLRMYNIIEYLKSIQK